MQDLLFATRYRVETESLLNHLLLGWQRRGPKLGIPRLTAGMIRINVLNNFLDYNVRIHEQGIHLRIDNSVQILVCVSSAQAGGTEQRGKASLRQHLNTDLHYNQ